MKKNLRYVISSFKPTAVPTVEKGCFSKTHTGFAHLSVVTRSKKISQTTQLDAQVIKVKSFDLNVKPGEFKKVNGYFIPVESAKEYFTFAG